MNGCMSLIASVWNWSYYSLTLAIFSGLYAGLLAIVVLGINALVRRWLSARQMGLLWGLVLLRLVLPIGPSSPLSLQNLRLSTPTRMSEPRDVSRQLGTVSGGATGWQPLGATAADANSPAPSMEESAPQLIDSQFAVDLLSTMLPVIWLIGGATGLTWTILVHHQFCRRLKQVSACKDGRLCTLWGECCLRAGLRRSVPIILFDGVQQPAVSGLFRPRLLLPLSATELTDEQLRMVMLHELAHVRHFDIAANWVLVVIRAIHWWNPVYWLAAARLQGLREQSCDAFAIRRIGGQPTRGYSELLLMLAESQPSGPPWRVMLPVSILGFFSSFFRKHAVRNRLKALRFACVTRSRWHTAAVAGLVVMAAVCGLTDASTPVTPPDYSSEWLPRAGHDWNDWAATPAIDPGPMMARTYDMQKALDRIAADERTEDGARANMHCIHQLLANLVQHRVGHRNASTSDHRESQDLQIDSEAKFTIDGATLTVTAPLGVHAEIARNLQAWEQSGLGQICVATRFLTDERDIASAIGVSWQYLEAFSADREEAFPAESATGMPVVRAKAAVDDYLPITVAVLNKEQATALLQTAQSDRRANVLQAPKITFFNGHKASVMDCTQTPFVVGFQADRAGVQQPKFAIIEEGIKLTLRAIHSSDTTKVQLEGRIELSHLDDVRTATTLLRGKPTTVQIPRVKRCRIDVSSDVPDGQSLLIGCIPTYEQKKFTYVLLTVQNIETN